MSRYDTIFTNVDSLYLDFGHDWKTRYKYEPFREDLRNPSLSKEENIVEIVEGSEQADRVLGGEGGCWGKCMEGLVGRSGRWDLGGAPLEGLMAMAERFWSPKIVRDPAVSTQATLTAGLFLYIK